MENYNTERSAHFIQEKLEFIELAYSYLCGNDQRLPHEVPRKFFHTINKEKTMGIYIEVYQNDENFPDGCFDLVYSEITIDKDGFADFIDNRESETCSLEFIRSIIMAESPDEIEKVMLKKLNRFMSIFPISDEQLLEEPVVARVIDTEVRLIEYHIEADDTHNFLVDLNGDRITASCVKDEYGWDILVKYEDPDRDIEGVTGYVESQISDYILSLGILDS